MNDPRPATSEQPPAHIAPRMTPTDPTSPVDPGQPRPGGPGPTFAGTVEEDELEPGDDITLLKERLREDRPEKDADASEDDDDAQPGETLAETGQLEAEK